MDTSPAYTRIVEVYDTLVVDDVYDVWADFILDAWSGGGAAVARVLDVGCGTGLLAEQLLGRGLDVVGVDASGAMIDRARERLGPAVELVVSALPALDVEGPFDGAVSTFDTLNYVGPADLVPSFMAIAGVLRVGGVLVFDVHTDAMLDFSVEHPVVSGQEHGWTFSVETTVDAEARTCVSRLETSALDGSSSFSEEHLQFFHGVDDLDAALAAAGFEVLAVTDEYTSAPVTAQTLRATWIARRIA